MRPDPQPASGSELPSGTTPAVIAVGGIDPGCGAGLARDILTASALGSRVWIVGTAWTDQGPGGVRSFEPRAPSDVARALEAALNEAAAGQEGGPPRLAVKIGMVATPAVADAVQRALAGFRGPVVVDPVLSASGGGLLFSGQPAEILPLARRATLLTPNAPEASALTGRAVPDADRASEAAHALRAQGVSAVLVKGGHLAGDPVDVLVGPTGEHRFAGRRLPGPTPRGTGCALATAITVALARGAALEEAILSARGWLADRISRALTNDSGQRHLPL